MILNPLAWREKARPRIERFLAAGTDRPDPDDAALARLCNAYLLFVGPALVFFVALYVAKHLWWDVGVILPMFAFWALAFALVRSRRNVRLAAHVWPVAGWYLMFTTALISGFGQSRTVWWLVVVPFIAAHLLGARWALRWGAISAVSMLGLRLVTLAWPAAPVLAKPDWMTITTSQVMLLGVLMYFGVSARRLADNRIAELRERERTIAAQAMELAVLKNEAEAAKDEAIEVSKLKSQFLANMSHEIRTPMNGVLGMTELMLTTEMTREQRDFVHTIRSSGETLLTVINDILDFSKIEAGRLDIEYVTFRLRQLVEEVVQLFAEKANQKGIELTWWVAPEVPDGLSGDPTRIRQILSNLVSNAIKFTDSGEVVARVSQGGGDVEFSVQDTGIGIDSVAQSRLFEAFVQADGSTTRKYGGTGLGLAISKQLVTLMGGKMGLSSEAGAGSTFRFELPLDVVDEATQRALADRADDPLSIFGYRALVVDDNETNRVILSHQLRGWGMEVVAVANGTDALATLESALGSGSPVDVVLLDQQMPGMDGLEVARAASRDAQRYGQAPRILLSSGGGPTGREDLESAGLAASLSKPVRYTFLSDALVSVLHGVAAEEAPGRLTELALGESEVAGMRVLVVDDNPVNRRIAMTQLEKLGCRPHEATNGLEALHEIEAGEPYDIVFMDHHMPVMDGLAATGEVRRAEARDGGRRLPIVALTASALATDVEATRAAGMDDFLAKPYRISDLREVLLRWRAGHASRAT